MRAHLMSLLLLLFLAGQASALMPPYSDAFLVRGADRVVVARVISGGPSGIVEGRDICTPWYLVVERDIVGSGNRNVTLLTEGGYLPNEERALWVEDQPQPVTNERAVIFLSKIKGEWWANGLWMGYRPVEAGERVRGIELYRYAAYLAALAEGRDLPLPERAPAAPESPMSIGGFTPIEGVSGDGTVPLTITGSGFGAATGKVQFTWYQWSGFDPTWLPDTFTTITLWTDTEIHCDVPPRASSGPILVTPSGGSGEMSTDVFNVWFGYQLNRWALATPVNIFLTHNDATYPVSEAGTALSNAISSWSAAGAWFRYHYAGTTTDGDAQYDGGPNGNNAMHWGTFPGTPPLGQCRIRLAGPPLLIVEMDIRFDITEAWSAGDPITDNDAESCALHEMGHGLQLMDLYGLLDDGKVMFGVLTTGMPMRTLHPRDAEGARYIYGSDGTVGVTSSDPVPLSEGLRVSPNPVRDRAEAAFDVAQAGNVRLEIWDMLGRRLTMPYSGWLREGTQSVPFDVSHLTPGTYELRVVDPAGERRIRLVKP